MATKPVTPKEVVNLKKSLIPDAVIESFNELIAEKYLGGSSTFKQKDVVARMVKKGVLSEEIYKNGWLDVEDIFEKAGWKVEYDKPGYNESYDATFTFSKKKVSLYPQDGVLSVFISTKPRSPSQKMSQL